MLLIRIERHWEEEVRRSMTKLLAISSRCAKRLCCNAAMRLLHCWAIAHAFVFRRRQAIAIVRDKTMRPRASTGAFL